MIHIYFRLSTYMCQSVMLHMHKLSGTRPSGPNFFPCCMPDSCLSCLMNNTAGFSWILISYLMLPFVLVNAFSKWLIELSVSEITRSMFESVTFWHVFIQYTYSWCHYNICSPPSWVSLCFCSGKVIPFSLWLLSLVLNLPASRTLTAYTIHFQSDLRTQIFR